MQGGIFSIRRTSIGNTLFFIEKKKSQMSVIHFPSFSKKVYFMAFDSQTVILKQLDKSHMGP